MCKTETEYLEKLRKHAKDTRAFLSNKMKSERERSVCRAFLRSIGVPFQEQELIVPTDEPSERLNSKSGKYLSQSEREAMTGKGKKRNTLRPRHLMM